MSNWDGLSLAARISLLQDASLSFQWEQIHLRELLAQDEELAMRVFAEETLEFNTHETENRARDVRTTQEDTAPTVATDPGPSDVRRAASTGLLHATRHFGRYVIITRYVNIPLKNILPVQNKNESLRR